MNVWKTTEPDKRIKFRYWVYDWNDANLYIFQLDQKRQSTGDTYKMEYVISHDDADGNSIAESHILELKETYFQSFYVPNDHTLTNVYFLTGNKQEGDVKPTIQLYAIAPSCFLANSLVGTQSNAFGGVEEAEENDEGR